MRYRSKVSRYFPWIMPWCKCYTSTFTCYSITSCCRWKYLSYYWMEWKSQILKICSCFGIIC